MKKMSTVFVSLLAACTLSLLLAGCAEDKMMKSMQPMTSDTSSMQKTDKMEMDKSNKTNDGMENHPQMEKQMAPSTM